MMAARGMQAFRKIQIGKEVTRGTAVATNKRIFGTLTITADKPRYDRSEEERAMLTMPQLGQPLTQQSRIRYEGAATFEQVIHWLLMGVKGGVSPTAPSTAAASVKLWTFLPSLTTRNAPNAYTFQYGDDIQAFRSKFGLVEELELTFPKNEEVRISANVAGHFPTTIAFTATTVPTLEEVVGSKTKIWIDASWAARGGTTKSNLLVNARLRLPTGFTPTRYHDGSLDFSDFAEQRRQMEVELTYISQADAVTEWKAYRDGTLRVIRLKNTGTIISTAAPSFTKYLQVDMALQYTEPPEVWSGAEDGENVIRLVGKTVLAPSSTGADRDFEIKIQNAVSAAS